MQSKLSQIFKVQKFLESINYPDSYRIAREIVQYISQNNNILLETILNDLKDGKPWEYVCGFVQFCNNEFLVTPATLIPRIETEQMVYECLEIVKNKGIQNILDVGTGSGCIIVSLKNLLKDNNCIFYATDISSEALAVAKRNEKEILESEHIIWINTDLIQDVPVLKGPTLLIANLPYIPKKQYTKLDKSVLNYEPQIALDGGVNGLYYYEKLFKQIKKKELNLEAIYIETESSIYTNTKDMIEKYFPHCEIEPIKDCFGKNRFFKISV